MTPETADTHLIADIRSLGDDPRRSIPSLADRVHHAVVEAHILGEAQPRNVISALLELANSPDQAVRERADELIFTHLVERLSDAFDPRFAELYDAVFSQIIDHERHLPECQDLDRVLGDFGLPTEQSLFERRVRLRAQGPRVFRDERIGEIIVLSRVTVGADVAITSVVVGTLRQRYPSARILLVAPPRIGDLFQGDPLIEILQAPYPRHGHLAERLMTWVEALDLVAARVSDRGGRALWVDTDSRLTQLGLLPVTRDDARYRIFESRSAGAGEDRCLGELAAHWAQTTFGDEDAEGNAMPYICLSQPQLLVGARSVSRLSQGGAHRVISVSFGVGGNPQKRAGEAFEAELLLQLVGDGHRILLDRGVSTDREAADGIGAKLRSRGLRVLDANAGSIEALDPSQLQQTDIVTWTGGLGPFSAMIGASDLYIGYDSAFQHVAAALETPLIAVVLGSPGPLFRQRWRPYSKARVELVPQITHTQETPNAEFLLSEVLGATRRILGDY